MAPKTVLDNGKAKLYSCHILDFHATGGIPQMDQGK